jgi:hypothetical protein
METQTPVVVTMIGNGTGDGGMPVPDGTTLKTPDNRPDVTFNVVSRALAIGIRALNVFLTVFLSLSGIGNIAHAVSGSALPAIDFNSAVWFAVLAALGEGAKSLLTITTGLEKKYPLGTGSI